MRYCLTRPFKSLLCYLDTNAIEVGSLVSTFILLAFENVDGYNAIDYLIKVPDIEC